MSIVEKLIAEEGTVIDVRTPGEFAGGSVPNARNIPLNEVPNRVDEFRNMKQPLILCCQSGNRSGQACAYLGTQGISCHNGGSWLEVNYMLSQKVK